MSVKYKGVEVLPDGWRYLAAGRVRVPYPFHLRWLLPFLLRDNVQAWTYVNRASIIGIGLLVAWYAGSPWMACVSFLPAFLLPWRCPVLVDAPAMFLAIAAAVVWPYSPPVAVAIVLIAGCTRETAPIWAAVYAWNPILLIGMASVAVRTLFKPGPDVLADEEHAWILRNPLKVGMKYHGTHWNHPAVMITPWGGLVLALLHIDAQLITALMLGYAQMLVATDAVRLYQWSLPVVALACVAGVPDMWLPFVALSVVFNPIAGDGV